MYGEAAVSARGADGSRWGTVGLACLALAVAWLLCRPPSTPRYRYVLFSDLDGTLVHFARDVRPFARVEPVAVPVLAGLQPDALWTDLGTLQQRLCLTVPSSTSGPAYISVQTHALMRRLRAAG
eukprot:EG_transcript_48614